MDYLQIKSIGTVSVLNRKQVSLCRPVRMCSHQSHCVQYVKYGFRTQRTKKRAVLSTVSVLNRSCLNDVRAFIHAGFRGIYGNY